MSVAYGHVFFPSPVAGIIEILAPLITAVKARFLPQTLAEVLGPMECLYP